MFAKISLWLTTDNIFQKYISSDGEIHESELIEAVKAFLRDHWKYDGVLW